MSMIRKRLVGSALAKFGIRLDRVADLDEIGICYRIRIDVTAARRSSTIWLLEQSWTIFRKSMIYAGLCRLSSAVMPILRLLARTSRDGKMNLVRNSANFGANWEVSLAAGTRHLSIDSVENHVHERH